MVDRWTTPVTDEWLIKMAQAEDIAADCERHAARRIVPDTWDRRKRIKRHEHQAIHYDQLGNAFRELLAFRTALHQAPTPRTEDGSRG